LTDADDLVLARQFRPSLEEHTLELLSGHVDTGETAIAAAARELSEETGYIPESLQRWVSSARILGGSATACICFSAKSGVP